MKKKIIAASIVIIIAIVFGYFITVDHKKDTILVCDLPETNLNYQEQLVFYFKGSVLEKFFRKEKFFQLDKKMLESADKYFTETKESIKNDLGEYITYTLDKGSDEYNITTYIYVPRKNEFFDYYFASKELYHFMTLDMIKTSLEEENYICKVK